MHALLAMGVDGWDAPNIMRGDTDSGERSFGQDYVQNMVLWSLLAACAPGGLFVIS